MKLKTTINGKRSTVIGTAAEVAEFLKVFRRKTLQHAADHTPTANPLAGEPVLVHINGQTVERKSGPIHAKDAFKPTFNAISQTREEIVKEAIADVVELLGRNYYKSSAQNVVTHVGSVVGFDMRDRVDFFVNKTKRVVVAKLWIEASTGTASDEAYATTGIARCAPSDVFNEHVGKAIALRRALGLEVPTKYYEVGGIVPEGKQVGDVVRGPSYADSALHTKTLQKHRDGSKSTVGYQSMFAERAKVIDDSARYVAPSTPAAKVVYVD